MCCFFSSIVTRSGIIFDQATDSHKDLLEKAKIKDESASPNFVRIELLPKDDDIFNHDLNNWYLHVDQDLIPEWFNKIAAEDQAKKVVQQLFKEIFIINMTEWQKVVNKPRIFIKNSKIEAINISNITARENSQVTARENSQVLIPDSYRVVVLGVLDNSIVSDIPHKRILIANNSPMSVEKYRA